MSEQNWAGCYTYTAGRIHLPTTVGQAQQLVCDARTIRALGSRHSFNDLADSPGDLLSLTDLRQDIQIDSAAGIVDVGAGVRYGELAQELQQHGWALQAMASLPHIAVGGAIATATHGSGNGIGSLASAVVGLELITAQGDLVTISQHDPDLAGATVHLGALGINTRVRLRIEPSYDLTQYVFNDVPWDYLADHFDEVTASAYSVSLFTDWNKPVADQVWLKSRTGPVSMPVGTPAQGPQHPVRTMDPANVTEQGTAGPWQDRLPHFRMGFTPSSGAEIQAEYLVPRSRIAETIRILRGLGPQISELVQVCELRTVAPENLWMSMSYGRDTVALHFTFDRASARVRGLLQLLESALEPCQPRPHWGKWFGYSYEQIEAQYPRIEDFRALVRRYDPAGKFHNEFLQRTVLKR